MATLRVRVVKGRLVGEAPPGLSEGTELELCLADPGDEMSEAELAELNNALELAWDSVHAGRVRSAEEVIAELRRKNA